MGAKLKLLGRLFLLTLLVKCASAALVAASHFLGLKGVGDLIQGASKLTDTYSLWFSILLVVVLLPILEEFAFRGWFSENKLLTSISLTTFLFYVFYILIREVIEKYYPMERITKFSAILISLTIGFYFVYKNFEIIKKFISKNHRTAATISISFFTFIHVFNYQIKTINLESILSLLIILSPHPVIGYFLIRLRINNGLIWSVALHILNNSLVLFAVFLGNREI